MLNILNMSFELDRKSRQTAFFIHDENGTLEISLDVDFETIITEEDEYSPCIFINPFETKASSVEELIGECFTVKGIEKSLEREDLFYLWEHEPFVEYTLTILDVSENTVRIRCVGTAVTDGYSKPYETAPFDLDCWLPIIRNVTDWEALGI